MKGRWDMARLRLWNKLISRSNPLASWVYRQRREEFESKGRKDQRNWCWYTWKILQELGKEVDWKVEYTGDAWLEGVKEAIYKREEEEWKSRMWSKPRLRTYRLVKEQQKRPRGGQGKAREEGAQG